MVVHEYVCVRMYVEQINEHTQSHQSLAYEYHGNTFYTFPVFTATAYSPISAEWAV